MHIVIVAVRTHPPDLRGLKRSEPEGGVPGGLDEWSPSVILIIVKMRERCVW